MRNKRKKLLIQNDARRVEDLDEDEERPPQWAQPLHVYVSLLRARNGRPVNPVSPRLTASPRALDLSK